MTIDLVETEVIILKSVITDLLYHMNSIGSFGKLNAVAITMFHCLQSILSKLEKTDG